MTDPANNNWNLLGLEGLSHAEISELLDVASSFEGGFRGDELAGRIVANLFFENSTRTRCSFEVAASRLGATSINITSTGSSVAKGESELETAEQLDAMGVDVLIVRSSVNGTPQRLAARCRTPIVNAGDGRHEHPTQGLLDLYTMRAQVGSLKGLKVAIVGDISNSRVARSNLHGLESMGAHVTLVGPPGMVDESFEGIGPHGQTVISHDLDEVLPRVDVVMMLRIQRERGGGSLIPPDYRGSYGLTAERAGRLQGHQWLMHPGPVNPGVEIDRAVLDTYPRCLISNQVANGVLVRAAVLTRVLARP
ncbi:MAG: aspartate carbamoyltransferase [Planctomycetes bacterium TMED75]|nr:aspartate carbamoyltransferase [Planctomycetaceae bacterium]OUU91548.1 MAG: aspartate carbamoyltransferase [Planctomycetes bacterium TMED75]